MQKNDSYELDDDELVEDLAVSQPLLQQTALELSLEIMTQSTSSTSRRDAKTAILSEMHALQESKEIQRQKLLIAELGQLQPIGFIRNDFEYNLLADGNTISTILEIEDPASLIFQNIMDAYVVFGHTLLIIELDYTLILAYIILSSSTDYDCHYYSPF